MAVQDSSNSEKAKKETTAADSASSPMIHAPATATIINTFVSSFRASKAFLDEELKKNNPIGAQTVTETAEAPSGKQKLKFEKRVTFWYRRLRFVRFHGSNETPPIDV